jgi:hypothetical protein
MPLTPVSRRRMGLFLWLFESDDQAFVAVDIHSLKGGQKRENYLDTEFLDVMPNRNVIPLAVYHYPCVIAHRMALYRQSS